MSLMTLYTLRNNKYNTVADSGGQKNKINKSTSCVQWGTRAESHDGETIYGYGETVTIHG